MKYNINLNQKALVELAPKLDIVDGAILSFLKDFYASDDKKIKQMNFEENGVTYRYTWVNYNHLIEEMPLLGIKQKASITNRLKKIESSGFIKTFKAPNQNVYIRITEKIKDLSFEPLVKTNGTISEDKYPLLAQTNSNNNNITQSRNKIINTPSAISLIFAYYKEKILKGARMTSTSKARIEGRLKKYTVEQLKEAIDRFSQDSWRMENNARLGTAWFFRNDEQIEIWLNLRPEKKVLVLKY